jgi:2-polyprenyl-6-methoxyphenol hydroxylase-like FAD-dependent oxidoreductase
MRIAINGTGVAGPTLAWWLKQYGYTPVLFERASSLRTGGYMIDFWGIGYDIAEKMGIVADLKKKGYLMEALRVVDQEGHKIASMNVSDLRSFIGDRFLSIARGDLAETIYHACGNVETRFGTYITKVKQFDDGVIAQLSNGNKEKFDLVIGADGLHSQIRKQVFGPDQQFEHSLGAFVVAFTLPGYKPRDELIYVSHVTPKMQVARVALRDDLTLFLFTFRSELVKEYPKTIDEEKTLLRSVFGNVGWEVPSILHRLDEVDDFYFDHVSQVRMDRWSRRRVALVGDAAACVSLLAGEGIGLAMTEAYVLAGELYRAGGDHKIAFRNYEKLLKPFLIKKQKLALKMIAFFAPKNRFHVFLSRLFVRSTSIPFLSKFLIGQMLRDDIDLPDYTSSSS